MAGETNTAHPSASPSELRKVSTTFRGRGSELPKRSRSEVNINTASVRQWTSRGDSKGWHQNAQFKDWLPIRHGYSSIYINLSVHTQRTLQQHPRALHEMHMGRVNDTRVGLMTGLEDHLHQAPTGHALKVAKDQRSQ